MTTSVRSQELTPKQDRFARFLFQGNSQREAWRLAGYSMRYRNEWIDSHACRLAANGKVKSRLAELQARVDDVAIMTEIERRKRLSAFGRANLVDFVDADGNIKLDAPNNGAISELSIDEWRMEGKESPFSSRTKKIKLINPIAAIAELNKMEHIYETGPANINAIQINIVFDNPPDQAEAIEADE